MRFIFLFALGFVASFSFLHILEKILTGLSATNCEISMPEGD